MKALVILLSSIVFFYSFLEQGQISKPDGSQEDLKYKVEADRFFYESLDCELISVRIISVAPNGQRLLAASGVWNYQCDPDLFANYIDANDSFLKECGEVTILDKNFLGFKMVAENYEGACILDLMNDKTHGKEIEKNIKSALEKFIEE